LVYPFDYDVFKMHTLSVTKIQMVEIDEGPGREVQSSLTFDLQWHPMTDP